MNHPTQLPEKSPRFFDELELDEMRQEPVLKYITEWEIRAVIFRNFQKFATYTKLRPALNAIALGIIMVAPISQLQAQLETMRNSSNPWCEAQGVFEALRGATAVSGIRAFVMKGGSAAHSFSYSAAQGDLESLCIILGMFWDEEEAGEWRKLFENTDITESSANLACLARHVHHWFDDAKFALKPLRKTEEGAVVVQFHWLKSSNGLKPYALVEAHQEASPFSDVLARAGLSDNDAWGDRPAQGDPRAHEESDFPLKTGQTLVLGAKHPGRAPSFELLQLDWDLQRMAAISGATESLELGDGDDEYDLEVGYSDSEEDE